MPRELLSYSAYVSKKADDKLGARFDQRRFHDTILAVGSVPLTVLEQRMAQFIADESAAPKQ